MHCADSTHSTTDGGFFNNSFFPISPMTSKWKGLPDGLQRNPGTYTLARAVTLLLIGPNGNLPDRIRPDARTFSVQIIALPATPLSIFASIEKTPKEDKVKLNCKCDLSLAWLAIVPALRQMKTRKKRNVHPRL